MSDKEVNSALNKLDRTVQTVLDLTAAGITKVAKDLCVVGIYKTGQVGGRLRGSISWSDESHVEMYEKDGQGTGAVESDKVGNSPNRDTRYIGTNVDYAPHVEFGTAKVEARAYLRPAAKQGNRILKQVLSQVKGITGSIK